MRPTNTRAESAISVTHSNFEGVCPLCGGLLADRRTASQCLRCAVSICVGCECRNWEVNSGDSRRDWRQ
jgi:hypothetical protein